MFKGKKVLVCGASGFVGTNLINKLLDLGAKVSGTLHNRKAQVIKSHVYYHKGDLIDKEFCRQICNNQDYIFMCAANTSGAGVMEKSPLSHVTPNILMNTMMLDAAYNAGIEKFMFLSSTTVYPLSDDPVKESDLDSTNLFEKYFCVASMKIFTEILCEMYANKIKNPMKTLVVRPGNLYGPYDDFKWETSHVIPALMRRVIERHDPLEVWGDGEDIKDFIYIDDFIDGMLLVMEKIDSFDPINISSGQPCSIKDVLKIIISVEKCEKDINVFFDKTKPTMIPKRIVDISKAKDLLDFEPKVSLKEGIKRTIEWYKKIQKMKGV